MEENPKIEVDEKTVDREFERWVDMNDLDLGNEGLDENEARDNEKDILRIKRCIRNEKIAIDENGLLQFSPKDGDIIVFYEPTGVDLAAMDRRKKDHDVSKMFATLGSVTKTSANRFQKMPMSDLKVCMSVITLFLV